MIELDLLRPKVLPGRCPFRTGDLVEHRASREKALVVRTYPKIADLLEVSKIGGRYHVEPFERHHYYGEVNNPMMGVKTREFDDEKSVTWRDYDLVKRPTRQNFRPRED